MPEQLQPTDSLKYGALGNWLPHLVICLLSFLFLCFLSSCKLIASCLFNRLIENPLSSSWMEGVARAPGGGLFGKWHRKIIMFLPCLSSYLSCFCLFFIFSLASSITVPSCYFTLIFFFPFYGWISLFCPHLFTFSVLPFFFLFLIPLILCLCSWSTKIQFRKGNCTTFIQANLPFSFIFFSSEEEKNLKACFRPFLAPSSLLMCVCLQVSEVPEHNISASLKVQMHHFELLLLDLENDVWFQLRSHFVLQVEFRLFHCKLRSRPDPSVGKS